MALFCSGGRCSRKKSCLYYIYYKKRDFKDTKFGFDSGVWLVGMDDEGNQIEEITEEFGEECDLYIK